ncbi:MAG TPA: hypothetical protein VFH50_03580 [Acidimicrobiales bacterium]|nr:hypothetical protein [Acidimicrobiales bacterium]
MGRSLLPGRGARGRVSRLGAAGASLAGLLMILVAGTGLAMASANAPNPSGAVTGSSVQNRDGSVTVSVSGPWSWDELPSTTADGDAKSSPQLKCADRYAIGWAVDWSDASTPYVIEHNGVVFHVGRNYDGQDTNLCADTAPDGAPEGTWSASHTYTDAAAVPAVLCVNVYDMHGKQGEPSKSASDYLAGGPGHDSDNSIETNDYNPNIGGNCFATPKITPAPNTSPSPSISVQKLNNASGGGYQQNESSTGPGEDVPFRVSVSNTSATALVIDSITDAYAGRTITPSCAASFVGRTLEPAGQSGDSATCDFTVAGYAPAAGHSLTDTVNVGGHSSSSPGQTTSGSATSTVTTPASSQTVAGAVMACGSNGQPTSTLVQGGSLSVLSGSTSVASAPGQLAATAVPAGDYTLSATAPSGYQFVSCGQPGVAVGSPATTATQPVHVPAGGAGAGTFYVAPVSGPQTIAGAILSCGNGQPTSTIVQGGTLSVLSGSTTVATAPDQLPVTDVPAGDYTLSATAPSGYQFVACGQPGVAIGSPATTATTPVHVPAGGAGTGTFYVTPVPAPATGSSVLGEQLTPPAAPAPAAPAPASPAPASAAPAQPTTAVLGTQLSPAPAAPAPTVAPAARSLAFTGAPTAMRWILASGLALMAGGCFLLWFTRPDGAAEVRR